jgi:hypothetical protein
MERRLVPCLCLLQPTNLPCYKYSEREREREILNNYYPKSVISVSYDSRYESYDTVWFYILAMQTIPMYWMLMESLQYSGAIHISYRIERFSDSILANRKLSVVASSPWSLLIASSPWSLRHSYSYRMRVWDRQIPSPPSFYTPYCTRQRQTEREITSPFVHLPRG